MISLSHNYQNIAIFRQLHDKPPQTPKNPQKPPKTPLYTNDIPPLRVKITTRGRDCHWFQIPGNSTCHLVPPHPVFDPPPREYPLNECNKGEMYTKMKNHDI